MKLAPKQPPGRQSRKARAYQREIAQLHSQGYSLEAIRQALEDVGVQVSRSTVLREARRSLAPQTLQERPTPEVPGSRPVPDPPKQPPDRVEATPHSPTPESHRAPAVRRRGAEAAESFVSGIITNPLLRNRSTP